MPVFHFGPPHKGVAVRLFLSHGKEQKGKVEKVAMMFLAMAANAMHRALTKIASYPDFPPSEWPPGTDPEHMWNDMVECARLALDRVQSIGGKTIVSFNFDDAVSEQRKT